MTVHKLRPFGIAAGYLAAAAALIAVAGSELAGPSGPERAARVEERAAAELASLAETAATVAAQRLRDHERRSDERREALEAALAAAVRWAADATRGSGPDAPQAELADALVSAGPFEDPALEGVAVRVCAPDGAVLFESGGELGQAPGETLGEVLGSGLTVIVAHQDREDVAESLRGALSGAARIGTGLYFLARDGSVACEVSPRPVPLAPLGGVLSAGTAVSASGELRTGRLVSARAAVAASGWTAVAERFLPPNVLAEGPSRALGTVALAGLGLLAAAAFAHATSAALERRSFRGGEATDAPRAAAAVAQRVPRRVAAAVPVQDVAPADPAFVGGRSILRLRETLGGSVEGPDLAACARSPILRALSRHVRSGGGALPRELRDRLGAAGDMPAG